MFHHRLFPFFLFLFSFAVRATDPQDHQDFFTDVGAGVLIRSVFMPAAMLDDTPLQVVIYVPGRTSCFENNEDLARRLTGRREDTSTKVAVDFWSIDNRGHGKSGGRLEHTNGRHNQRCHIDSFDTYLTDLQTVIRETILPKYRGQEVDFTLMGMSMGGNIVLRYLQEHEGEDDPLIRFKQAVVISPMVKFLTPGFPEIIAWGLAKIGTFLGFGQYYIPGHGERNLSDGAVRRYTGSHNQDDFLSQQAFYRRYPDMLTDGATYGWIKAAYESVTRLQHMHQCSTPVVAFLAGDDRHVDAPAARVFLSKFESHIYRYPGAYHVLTREPDHLIPGFWHNLFRLFKTT